MSELPKESFLLSQILFHHPHIKTIFSNFEDIRIHEARGSEDFSIGLCLLCHVLVSILFLCFTLEFCFIDVEACFNAFSFFYRSSIPNGQPKWLLSFIPDYPMLNFMLTTTIYLFVSFPISGAFRFTEYSVILISSLILQLSYRVFELTNVLKNAFVPSRDNNRLYQNFIAGIAISVCLYCCSLILLKIPVV